MNQLYDILLILTFQIILLIGFIYLIKFWFKKKMNIFPIITYWVLGLFFVLLMSFNIFDWVLKSTFYSENSLLGDEDSLGSISSLLAIGFYIYIGTKYFRKKSLVV